jgi:mono/diheme cytochrome c family protein
MPVWNLLNNYLQSRQAVSISRGAYLIDTLGHCHECHTPRNLLGMLQMDKKLQGNESLSSPDISQSTNGIGDWSDNELTELFIEGVLPDGDYVADHMAEVVEFSTSKWNSEDLSAAINYLRSIK